ncbi:MAG: EF-hand domain-containing protein [Pirellulaceae bacterium]
MHKLLFSIAVLGGVVLGGGALGALLFAEDPDLFTQLDANKDGFISDDEVEGSKKTLFDRLVRVSDENGDKKLSKDEFAKGTQKSAEAKPPLAGEPGRAGRPGGEGATNIKEFLTRLDKNGDGKISKEEAPDRMKENFDRLDANKDGFIEAEEFARTAGALGGRPAGAPPGTPASGGGDAKAAEEAFAKHDANSDGKLTKDEVPDEQKEMFQRISDRLGADSLTKEQFVRALTQRRPEGGHPPEGRPGEPGRPGAGPMVALPVLKALDADGDGEISKAEIEGASKALAALDKNGDGKLSREEILPNFGAPGRPGQPGQPGIAGRFNPEEMLRRLKEADKNGDGKISKDEAPDRMKDNFDRIDANGDGQLEESEIKVMGERFREGAGRRPEAGRPEGRPERKPEEKKE